MLFIVHYIGKKFIVCLLDKFFESFVVLFTELGLVTVFERVYHLGL